MIPGGHRQPDFGKARGGKGQFHGVPRHGGGVVLPAQVGKDDLLRAPPRHLHGKAGGIVVGEVSVSAQDALLEIVGVGTRAQPLHVVVALQHQKIYTCQDVEGLVGDVAGVGQDAHAAAFALHPVVHAAPRVVGGGEGRHGEAADGEGFTGAHGMHPVLGRAEFFTDLCRCAGGGVEGGGVVLAPGPQTRDVVGVAVGEEDGGNVVRRQSQLGQSGGDAPGGDAGIHEKICFAVVNQQAVALAAAGEGVQGHQWEIPRVSSGKTAFTGDKPSERREKVPI